MLLTLWILFQLSEGYKSKTGWVLTLPDTSFWVGGKNPDVNRQNGEQHTKEGDRSKLADEADAHEDTDDENDQKAGSVHPEIVEGISYDSNISKYGYRWCHISLKHKAHRKIFCEPC